MRHFPQFSGLLPYSQNTALKRNCKVLFVLCFVLKILFEKNTVGGTRNDPFGRGVKFLEKKIVTQHAMTFFQPALCACAHMATWLEENRV